MSQLFFFDGEKIREIADGEEDNEQLAHAVRGLLGIELVGRLRTDLGLFLARHQREDNTGTGAQIEAVIHDLGKLERRTVELAEEIAELTTARDSQARAAEQIRRRFIAEGGDAAAQRGRIEAQLEEVRRAITRCQYELHDLADGLLPFTLAPRLVDSFRAALEHSGSENNRHDIADGLHRDLMAWRDRERAEPKRQALWNDEHWSDLTRFVDAWSERSDSEATLSPAFIEVGDGTAALARLSEVEMSIRPRAVALGAELETLTGRLGELETALSRADNAASGVLLDELRLSEQQVGSTEAMLHAKQEELKGLRGQQVTLERERSHLLEEQAGAAAVADRAALAARAALALADYERRLLDHKLAQLRTKFIRQFNHLAHKGDLIADVRIDPESFVTTLIDSHGREVPKAALSAGEKQVYAIAMLWALARTSGRPLPMIIDTPLARLDSEHRSNLIERYFPAASHQVVLLSTDTEVDDALLGALGRSVSHTYRLDYDPEEGRTNVSPGYLGPAHNEREERRALQQT